jgi:hypothetical protein
LSNGLPPTRVRRVGNHIFKVRAWEHERTMMAAAAEAGWAPHFEVIGQDEIRMPYHTPLEHRLREADADDKRAVAQAVLTCIAGVHAAGICHRDAHRDNFVVDGDRALLIDFELACHVDPARPCYDLYGPASGVEVPAQHAFLGVTEGFWWDSPATRKTMLWREFGRLAELMGPTERRG